MFKIEANPTFNVKVDIPIAGGQSQPLPITFKHKTRTELKTFMDQVTALEDDDERVTILSGVIENWEADVKFSKGSFITLLENYPAAFGSIFKAYYSELLGAKLGN